MKTIIIKLEDGCKQAELGRCVTKLEKYIDHQIDGAVVCTRYLSSENYNTVAGELKDATKIDDFDIFIVGVADASMDVTPLQSLNKAHTLTCCTSEYDSAKNYVIML